MFRGMAKWLRGYANKDGRGYPDWAVRYRPVCQRLVKLKACGGRILEIGANENGLARFLAEAAKEPQCPVIVADTSAESLGAARHSQRVAAVRADIAALPFGDGAMDTCVCMDTFEHLNPEQRHAASREIVRVLKKDGTALAGFPSGEGAREAEAEVRQAYAKRFGRTLAWFEEHDECALPDAMETAAQFERLAGVSHRVEVEPNAPLWMWRMMWHVLLCGWPGRGNAVFQAGLRLVTPLMCRVRWGVCYRSLVWLIPRTGNEDK